MALRFLISSPMLRAGFGALALAGTMLGIFPSARAQAAADAPAKPHAQRADHGYNLDFLFGALKAAPDDTAAKLVEARIIAMWLVSGSDTVDLLMSRSKAAVDAKDYDLAIRLLDAVVALKPEFAEGWNRRATVFFLKKDYGRSMADISETLALEPRHFGALAGLGTILQEIGDEKRALEVYRRAIAVNPHLQRIPDLIKTLSEKVEGRDI